MVNLSRLSFIYCWFRILRIPSSSSSSCGGGGSPPLLPARSDSLSSREEAELRLAPWFQAGIPREVSILYYIMFLNVSKYKIY